MDNAAAVASGGAQTPEPSPTQSGLGRRAAAGMFWMTAQKWVIRLSGLVTIAILTRELEPASFGLVAAASTVIPLIMLLSDLGFTTYVVQAEDPDDRTLSTGFWFSIFAGVILSVALWAAAPVVGSLLDLPGLAPVLRVMTISVVFVALASMPNALMRRRMAFRTLAAQATAAAFIAQVVAVILALRGAGVWALVGQLLVGQALSAVLVSLSARWRPKMLFSLREFANMGRFGVKVVAVEFVALSRSWAETAIIASTLGATGLGYLNIAQRLVQVAQDLSAVALVPVSTVVFAQVRQSADRLRAAYLRALGVSYAVVAPMMTFVVVGAPVLIPTLFGDGWAVSVPVAQALAVAGIFTMGAMLDHGLFYGVGRPGSWLFYAIVIDALTVAATAYAIRFGLTGVALAFIGVAVVATVARWFVTGRLVGARVGAVARPFMVVAVCVAGSGGAGLLVMRLTASWPDLLSLTTTAACIGLVHVLLTRLLAPGVVRELRCLMPQRLGAKPQVLLAKALKSREATDPLPVGEPAGPTAGGMAGGDEAFSAVPSTKPLERAN